MEELKEIHKNAPPEVKKTQDFKLSTWSNQFELRRNTHDDILYLKFTDERKLKSSSLLHVVLGRAFSHSQEGI